MPVAGQAQPDLMPLLRFRFDGVVCLEAGLGPATVIRTGTPFTLRQDLGFEGQLAGLVTGQAFSVFHHIEEVQTGTRQHVAGGNFVVPAPPASNHITVTSPPISLPIPAGFASGTYRILTHVHANNPAVAPIVAAFHDGLMLMITP